MSSITIKEVLNFLCYVLFQWIFYLEGGGWCWNATSCLNRLVLNGILFGGSSLVSSSHWPPTHTFEDGIFVMEGSGWDEANLVYLPYCSSDAHMGDTQVWSRVKINSIHQ